MLFQILLHTKETYHSFKFQVPKHFPMPSLAREVDQSTLTVFSVLGLNLTSLIVLVTQHHLVLMLMVLEYAAIQHVRRTCNPQYLSVLLMSSLIQLYVRRMR